MIKTITRLNTAWQFNDNEGEKEISKYRNSQFNYLRTPKDFADLVQYLSYSSYSLKDEGLMGRYVFNACLLAGINVFPYLERIPIVVVTLEKFNYVVKANKAKYIEYPFAFSESDIRTFIAPMVEGLPGNTFDECQDLKSVRLDSAKSFNPEAFNNCQSLESVYAPNCSWVADYSFVRCPSLKNVVLSKEAIGDIENKLPWFQRSFDVGEARYGGVDVRTEEDVDKIVTFV